MNDQELADAVVELGIGMRKGSDYIIYDPHAAEYMYLSYSAFIRSWLVVGALMEKVDAHFIEKLSDAIWAVRSDKPYGEGKTRNWYEHESLPRAITEACVKALT